MHIIFMYIFFVEFYLNFLVFKKKFRYFASIYITKQENNVSTQKSHQ